jgi:hypothetical protein
MPNTFKKFRGGNAHVDGNISVVYDAQTWGEANAFAVSWVPLCSPSAGIVYNGENAATISLGAGTTVAYLAILDKICPLDTPRAAADDFCRRFTINNIRYWFNTEQQYWTKHKLRLSDDARTAMNVGTTPINSTGNAGNPILHNATDDGRMEAFGKEHSDIFKVLMHASTEDTGRIPKPGSMVNIKEGGARFRRKKCRRTKKKRRGGYHSRRRFRHRKSRS